MSHKNKKLFGAIVRFKSKFKEKEKWIFVEKGGDEKSRLIKKVTDLGNKMGAFKAIIFGKDNLPEIKIKFDS